MSGWAWASVDDFNAMVDSVIGSPALGSGANIYVETDSAWAPQLLSTFRSTTFASNLYYRVLGFTRTTSTVSTETYAGIVNNDVRAGYEDTADSSHAYSKTMSNLAFGAWFYRPAP